MTRAGAGRDVAGDLPPYTVRVSTRAKHVRLTVTPRDGLVVVVPLGLEGLDPTAILRDRRDWIAEALAHFAERRAVFAADPTTLLPREVRFAATGEAWSVTYAETPASHVRVRERGGELAVSGAVGDAAASLAALRRWLHRAAAARLLPLLAEEASRAGVTVARASVRAQRARWGSCSPSGAIALNRALLFLDRELCVAAIRHELAHIAVPNHSPAFYAHLETIDPLAETHAQAIARSWDAVPPWAEP